MIAAASSTAPTIASWRRARPLAATSATSTISPATNASTGPREPAASSDTSSTGSTAIAAIRTHRRLAIRITAIAISAPLELSRPRLIAPCWALIANRPLNCCWAPPPSSLPSSSTAPADRITNVSPKNNLRLERLAPTNTAPTRNSRLSAMYSWTLVDPYASSADALSRNTINPSSSTANATGADHNAPAANDCSPRIADISTASAIQAPTRNVAPPLGSGFVPTTALISVGIPASASG